MVANNDITGDAIMTPPVSKAYRDNYDQIFRKKKIDQEPEVELWEKITYNQEVQEALKRLQFTISSEIGKVQDLSAKVYFEDGKIEEIWIN